jgi:hypothetical protein
MLVGPAVVLFVHMGAQVWMSLGDTVCFIVLTYLLHEFDTGCLVVWSWFKYELSGPFFELFCQVTWCDLVVSGNRVPIVDGCARPP